MRSTRATAAGETRASHKPAVRSETFLRGEVVDVELRRLDPQARRRRRSVHGHESARVRAVGPSDFHHHAGRGLIVGEGVKVDPRPAFGRRVSPDRAFDYLRGREPRRRLGRGGELRRELAEREVLAALFDKAERGDIPESGRAAVAEGHFVAVGELEQFAQALTEPRRRGT